ncbi:MAG: hypothetical protein A3K19_20660 [Lentisphaerae bacterium RIFOXYB12_FULL_65_16]|nr:MAG: hypothetical protein A3K18_22250 [Lentisphaerae bacterium RIFOXYA12_64_32]OGV89410.1 MAG: hypothetical protein A3K19_20660 [Lentisphaerae bacterium RIFOXYB12_FULL_65_16]
MAKAPQAASTDNRGIDLARLQPEALAGLFVFAIGCGWFSFWLYGQTFFDDDYGRCMVPLQSVGFSKLFCEICRPFPVNWGFLYRPVEFFAFKLGYSLFGDCAAWFFVVKTIVVATLAWLIHQLARECSNDQNQPSISGRARLALPLVAPLLFVTAEPVFMSMLWLCDFEVAAETCLCLTILLYMRYRRAGWHLQEWSRGSVLRQLLILLVAMVGFRSKETAKLLPFLIFLHCLWSDRRSLRHFLPLLACLVAVNVPWLYLAESPLPDFLFGNRTPSATAGYSWSRVGSGPFITLLLGNLAELWPFSASPRCRPYGLLQVLLPFPLAACGLAAFACRSAGAASALREPAPDPVHADRLLLLWLLLSTLILAAYPRIPEVMIGRYLTAPLIPAFLLIGRLLTLAWRRTAADAPARRLVFAALACLALQLAAGAFQCELRKQRSGTYVVLHDMVKEYVETNFRGARVLFIGFPDHGYWPSTQGNTYMSSVALNDHDLSRIAVFAPTHVVTLRNEPSPAFDLQAEIRLPDTLYNRLLRLRGSAFYVLRVHQSATRGQ